MLYNTRLNSLAELRVLVRAIFVQMRIEFPLHRTRERATQSESGDIPAGSAILGGE